MTDLLSTFAKHLPPDLRTIPWRTHPLDGELLLFHRDSGLNVLLDGVDEVADFPTRQRVARLVERFTIAYPDNRYVVTSRVVGYIGAARLGEGYATTTVRDFTQADIERFVTYWNRAVEAAEVDHVPLNRGTRHTTLTALRTVLRPEELQQYARHDRFETTEEAYLGELVAPSLAQVPALLERLSR